MLDRRDTLLGLVAALAMSAAESGAAALAAAGRREGPFSWDILKAQAREIARKPFKAPVAPGVGLDAIDFDAATSIEYRPDRTLWPENGGGVRFFPLNRYARVPIQISVVDNGQSRVLPFSKDLFKSGGHLPPLVEGFAGFRLMTPNGKSDWLAFLGASYFRAAGPLDQYGLSARGLAINTGTGSPEEFPVFTHFWLEQGPDSTVIVYALMESKSCAGAWRFVNHKTEAGIIQEVSLSLDLRADVERLGFAPLTSMFWYGEGSRKQAIDWRPEIHDSDGLAMLTGTGERIWRPLVNPPHATTNSFSDKGPKGFGLLQRDRSFEHYQDDGVFYEKRPNLWIEPTGDWGPGAVTLYELPTDKEYEDNIVAFWVPQGPAKAGNHYELGYKLSWTASEPQPIDVACVSDSWNGVAGRPGIEPIPGATRFVADFEGNRLNGLTRQSGVEAVVSVRPGSVLHQAAYPVVGTKQTWRLVADIARDGNKPSDIRAFLKRGSEALTETLLYQLY